MCHLFCRRSAPLNFKGINIDFFYKICIQFFCTNLSNFSVRVFFRIISKVSFVVVATARNQCKNQISLIFWCLYKEEPITPFYLLFKVIQVYLKKIQV